MDGLETMPAAPTDATMTPSTSVSMTTNATSVSATKAIGDSKDVLNEYTKDIVTIIFYFVLQIPVVAFGIGTNAVNILVFRMSGLKDSVSIAFTALSISDLGYCTFFFVIRMNALLLHKFNVQSRVNLSWLSYYLSFYGVMCQDVSVVITVFVAIQKCCCVAIPHLFKNVFTSGRTLVILLCLSLSMVCTYLPILCGMRFVAAPTLPLSNETTVIVVLGPVFFKGFNAWLVFNKIVLPASSQGITIVCLVVMAVQLKKSAKFRTSMSSEGAAADINSSSSSANSAGSKSSSSKLSYKERRALTAVALVSAIFVISTIPASVLSYASLIATGFFSDPRYQSLRRLLNNSQNIPIHVSASVNMFIYLKYNSKYKETALVLFDRCFPESKRIHAKTDETQK